jgi:hypothetical protein
MPNAPATERSAAVFELAARLERYELGLEALSREGADARRYRILLRELPDAGSSTLVLPQFAADLMDITLRHVELTQLLCRPRLAPQRSDDHAVATLLGQQCGAVRAVRNKCVRLISRERRAHVSGSDVAHVARGRH